jgi:electron transport complex protein RnfE
VDIRELTKGIVRSNPIFVLLLGICPTLATSSSLDTAVAMGLAATFVLVCSNVVIAVIRNAVPKGVRIPCYIVVIASFVTIADLILQAHFRPVSQRIGIFIPLIVVNCIILGRAEAFASKNTIKASLLDGVGMGIGFTLGLMLIAFVRELFGSNSLFGHAGVLGGYQPMVVLVQAPGAFLLLGLMLGLFNWIGQLRKAR